MDIVYRFLGLIVAGIVFSIVVLYVFASFIFEMAEKMWDNK